MRATSGLSALLMAAGLLAATGGCGASDDAIPRSTTPAPVDVTTTTVAPEVPVDPTTTTVAPVVSTTVAVEAPVESTTTTTTVAAEAPVVSTTSATTLPGTPTENPYVSAGAVLGVVGIAFDETLSVHALPGLEQPVVGTLPPLARDVVASGRAQLFRPGEVYLEVTAAGITGWVDSKHVLYIAGPQDHTASAVSALDGTPRAPSMLELGRTVVDALGPPPDAPSRVLVVVAGPTDAPMAEVTFDEFFGEEFGDDSIAGDRYRVVGRQVADVEYELVAVEWTGLCWRGGSSGGLCV